MLIADTVVRSVPLGIEPFLYAEGIRRKHGFVTFPVVSDCLPERAARPSW